MSSVGLPRPVDRVDWVVLPTSGLPRPVDFGGVGLPRPTLGCLAQVIMRIGLPRPKPSCLARLILVVSGCLARRWVASPSNIRDVIPARKKYEMISDISRLCIGVRPMWDDGPCVSACGVCTDLASWDLPVLGRVVILGFSF